MATVIEIPSLSPSSTFGRLWPADSNASEDDGLAGVAILLQKLLDDAGSGRHPRRRILAAIMVVMVSGSDHTMLDHTMFLYHVFLRRNFVFS